MGGDRRFGQFREHTGAGRGESRGRRGDGETAEGQRHRSSPRFDASTGDDAPGLSGRLARTDQGDLELIRMMDVTAEARRAWFLGPEEADGWTSWAVMIP